MKKFGIIFLAVAVLLSAVAFFYIREERHLSQLSSVLERMLSEATGAEVAIGHIGGNIFRRVILYDLGCKLGDYTINFGRAQLGYSIRELLSKKISKEAIYNNVIELEGGSLRFKDNILSKEINGRINLSTDKVTIDSLDFELFSSLNSHIRGEIVRHSPIQSMDLQLKARPLFDRTNLFFKEAGIDIRGSLDNLDFNGSISRAEDLEILVKGDLVSSEGVLKFASALNLIDLGKETANTFLTDVTVDLKNSNFRAAITPSEGNIIINGDYSNWPLLTADITNDHIKIYNLDFSNIIRLAAKTVFKKETFSHIALDLNTESTILNFYPFDELEASFWIDKDLLRLIYLKVGDSISASGALSLKSPRRLFLKTTLADFEVSRFFLVSKEEERPIASGKMSGEAMVEGPLEELKTEAKLGVRGGYIGTIDYEDMVLNMKGTGPILTVHDSRLIREDSFMTMDGTLDLREIGRDKFLANLKVSTDPNTIVWEGWDISKTADESELRLKKGINGRVKVGFKKDMSGDETAYQAVRPQDEFELEYKMPDKESSLQLKAREKEEFLGLMKRYKF